MRRCALLFVVVLTGCGSPKAPGAPPVSVPQSHPTARAGVGRPAPAAASPLGVPQNAPLVATFSWSRGVALQLTKLFPAAHALRPLLDEHVIDTRRPITFAIAPFSSRERALVSEFASLSGSSAPSLDAGAQFVKHLRERTHELSVVSSVMRTLIPASNPNRFESTLRHLLLKQGWHAAARRNNAPSEFVMNRLALRFMDDGSTVAIDFAAGSDATRARAALTTALSDAKQPAPALHDCVARLICSPTQLTDHAFLMALIKMVGAIGGESLTQKVRVNVAAVGLREAASLLHAARGPRGARFDRIELTLKKQPFELDVRAKPGSGFTMPPDAAWAPAPSVTVDGALAEVGRITAFATALKLPNRHGWMKVLGASNAAQTELADLPQMLVGEPFAMSDAAPPEDVARSFEAETVASTADHKLIFVGLLPARITAAEAACSLAQKGCYPPPPLVLGKAVLMDFGIFAKLVRVKHRFAVLLANDPAALSARIQIRPAAPLHIEVSPKPWVGATAATFLPSRIAGNVARDAGDVVFRFAAR